MAKYVFNPAPIGSTAYDGPSKTIPVTLTAEDSSGAPVSGATVYLSFSPCPGGGSAKVGALPLTVKTQYFITDSAGHVTVNYSTPSNMPRTGVDSLKVTDTPTHPHIKVVDDFVFSPVARMNFSPAPLAPKGALGPNTTIQVTLTAVSPSGAALPNVVVFLKFVPAKGGGSATLNGVPLKSSWTQATTDGAGHVTVVYKSPATMPAPGGTDAISAQNTSSQASAKARVSYQY